MMCQRVEKVKGGENVELTAVIDDGANPDASAFRPGGVLHLGITDPGEQGRFKQNQFYFVEFTDASRVSEAKLTRDEVIDHTTRDQTTYAPGNPGYDGTRLGDAEPRIGRLDDVRGSMYGDTLREHHGVTSVEGPLGSSVVRDPNAEGSVLHRDLQDPSAVVDPQVRAVEVAGQAIDADKVVEKKVESPIVPNTPRNSTERNERRNQTNR